jgi:hypothetical protein
MWRVGVDGVALGGLRSDAADAGAYLVRKGLKAHRGNDAPSGVGYRVIR